MFTIKEERLLGITIEYGIHNEENIGKKPLIVFFHGTPGTICQGEIYCPELIAEGYPVLVWSRPGYRYSSISPTTKTFNTQAILLKLLLDKLEVEYFVGYGVSGGVPVMIQFCMLHADMMQGAIVESGVITRYDEEDRTLYQKISDYFLFTKLGHYVFTRMIHLFPKLFNILTLLRYSDLSFRQIITEAGYMTEDKIICSRLERFMIDISDHSTNRNGYLNDLNELKSDRTDKTDYLPEDVLILHGASDSETAIHEADRVRIIREKSWYVQVINGSHMLPLSSRHRYISDVKLKFLKHISNATGVG